MGFRIGDELENFTDRPFAGIVAAPSLRVVQKVGFEMLLIIFDSLNQ